MGGGGHVGVFKFGRCGVTTTMMCKYSRLKNETFSIKRVNNFAFLLKKR